MILERRIDRQRIVFGPLAESFAALALRGPVLAVGSARSLAMLDGITLSDDPIYREAAALPHNPQASVDAMRARADALGVRTIVAIGSSSAIDLGKAIRHHREALLVCVPTALGGAEMSRGFGIVRGDVKTGDALRSPSEVVLYDAAVLASLAPRELGSIGINAWAHTIEAAYARNAHPLGVAAAEKGGRELAQLLLDAVERRDEALHAALFEGAFLAGFALNACGMGLHHATCHVLGGFSGVPHGIVNAIVLPHALRANRELAPESVERVAAALGVPDLAAHAERIARAYGLPRTLAELGVDPEIMDIAPQRILAAPQMQNNPASVPPAVVTTVVRAAYGEKAASH